MAVATAMVGYGLVRSSMTTSPAGRGSIAAGAGAVAVLDRPAPRALPLTSKARTERLDELAEEIEKLKVGAGVRMCVYDGPMVSTRTRRPSARKVLAHSRPS